MQSFGSTTAEKSPSSLTLISVQVTFFPGKNQKHLFVPSVLNDQRWASDRSLCRHCPKLLMSHFCPATHVFPFWEIILNYFNDFFKPFSLCFLSHPLAWSANVLYFTSLFCIFLLCVLGDCPSALPSESFLSLSRSAFLRARVYGASDFFATSCSCLMASASSTRNISSRPASSLLPAESVSLRFYFLFCLR